MSKLTIFDAIVAVILSISLIFSLFKGMIREIFALVGYAGGYLVAVKYQDSFAPTLMSFVGNKTVAGIISFAVLFFSTKLVLSLIGKVVRGYVTAAPGLSCTTIRPIGPRKSSAAARPCTRDRNTRRTCCCRSSPRGGAARSPSRRAGIGEGAHGERVARGARNNGKTHRLPFESRPISAGGETILPRIGRSEKNPDMNDAI